MSGLLMGHAFYEELPPLPKLLLLAIADHANDDGHGAYPSQKRLAEKVGCSTRHINTLTSTLVSLGLLEITQQGGGRGHTTRYLLPWAEDVRRKLKGEKVEQTTTKVEPQSSSEPSLEPSGYSEPSDQSVDPPSPLLPVPFSAKFFAAEGINEQVAVLVDCAKANGREVRGGRIAGLLKLHKENKTAVMLAFMEAIARNVAVIEDYTEGVLQDEKSRRSGKAGSNAAGSSQRVGTADDWERAREYARGETDTP